jgi:hypothetical protein
MGRRVAGTLACLVLIGLFGACQPLYGGKPEKLHNPEKKKKPPEETAAVVEPKYIEDCSANFREDPKTARPQTGISNTLMGDGDTALQQSNRAKDPPAQAELIRVAIDKYRNALIKDPYNSEATLKLAIAYDLVYRKGCALAMLKRLADLSANPKFAKQANRNIDSVTDNTQWFKGYRKDAISKVGR